MSLAVCLLIGVPAVVAVEAEEEDQMPKGVVAAAAVAATVVAAATLAAEVAEGLKRQGRRFQELVAA